MEYDPFHQRDLDEKDVHRQLTLIACLAIIAALLLLLGHFC